MVWNMNGECNMRKKLIGRKHFEGSVDITDPCYDKDVWCRIVVEVLGLKTKVSLAALVMAMVTMMYMHTNKTMKLSLLKFDLCNWRFI